MELGGEDGAGFVDHACERLVGERE
jgi:hypothetical protein